MLNASGGSLLSEDMIEEQLGQSDIAMPNRSTIYRILNNFCDEGVTHKTISDEGKAYYALCDTCQEESHNHDHIHFQCESCEKVECLEENTSVKLPKGYKLKEANLWVKGLCPSCAG
jgi:Fur family ferric uptake transcriptional regulator